MNWDTVQQLIRILAQFAGGYLVSSGLLTEGLLEELTGGLLSLAAVAWWVFWEKSREDPKLPKV